MLLTGCVNPAGADSSGYNGLYLIDEELKDVIERRWMLCVPVKPRGRAWRGGARARGLELPYDGRGRAAALRHASEAPEAVLVGRDQAVLPCALADERDFDDLIRQGCACRRTPCAECATSTEYPRESSLAIPSCTSPAAPSILHSSSAA
jgi:hypothetical protein